MSDWITLSDRKDLGPDAPALVERGLFVLEFRLPVLEPAVLVQFHDETPFPRTFSVFFEPDAGISLLHRQGAQVKRHLLAGPIPQPAGTARLSFAFDAPARAWEMRYEVLGEGVTKSAFGTLPAPLPTADLQALCTSATGASRHKDVLWFGLTLQDSLPDRAPWIGLNTPIDTQRGPVLAGLLQPGDLIATLDNGFQPLTAVTRHTLPSRGTFAPVLLRTPFFGLNTDLLVSSDQLVLISGASVEYLYGVEEALISAASLCDGKVAEKDERRALTESVSLSFATPQAITADGCCLMSAYSAQDTLPRRALLDFEARPLLTLLGRTALRHVA